LMGHLLNWKSWNFNIKFDASWLLTKIKNRPMKEKDVKIQK
jgi:hypothetical protein